MPSVFNIRGSGFQSTRPVRGATVDGLIFDNWREISIHAPRAGRDFNLKNLLNSDGIISIHAPRAGRDPPFFLASSTSAYFNPRAPCGARLNVSG